MPAEHLPGTRVEVFGLTSARGRAHNGRCGLVQDKKVKVGRAAVLLEGDATPTSLSLANLHRVKTHTETHANAHTNAPHANLHRAEAYSETRDHAHANLRRAEAPANDTPPPTVAASRASGGGSAPKQHTVTGGDGIDGNNGNDSNDGNDGGSSAREEESHAHPVAATKAKRTPRELGHALANYGYAVIDNFLEGGAASRVEAATRQLYACGDFEPGAVGGGADGNANAYESTVVRGDHIKNLDLKTATANGLGQVIEAAETLLTGMQHTVYARLLPILVFGCVVLCVI